MKILGLYGAFGWDANNGIHKIGYTTNKRIHDSGATLFVDGKHVCSISEERLSRIKRDGNFPEKSIDYCLKEGQISRDDIDLICVPQHACPEWVKRYETKRLHKDISNIFPNAEIKFISHHACHAFCSIFTSEYNSGHFIVSDSGGSSLNHLERSIEYSSYGSFDKIAKKFHIHTIQNLFGSYYRHFSCFPYLYLMNKDIDKKSIYIDETCSGKVMGLSAYGKSENMKVDLKELYKIVSTCDLSFPFVLFDDSSIKGNHEQKKYYIDLSLKNKKIPINDWKDFSALIQDVFEESVTEYIKELKNRKYIGENVCFGGGSFLNVLCNTKIKSIINNTNIPPFPDDSGLHFGAAAWASNEYDNKVELPKNAALLGKEYSNEEIENELSKYEKLKYTKHDFSELCSVTANYIEQNKIIGWFQGRSEYGPRALGSRSILMSPKHKENKDTLNSRVKHREYWRPFAGIILDEYLTEYFVEDFETPYMLYSFTVKDEKVDVIPAITHEDKSCRIQTVNKEYNEELTELLNTVNKVTGIPIVLNTSFNDNGEPIVESPKDAIESFIKMDIDYLVIGNYIVEKII